MRKLSRDEMRSMRDEVRRFFKTLQQREGMTQKQIAAKIGVSPRTIRHWQYGDRGITEKSFKKIMNAFTYQDRSGRVISKLPLTKFSEKAAEKLEPEKIYLVKAKVQGETKGVSGGAYFGVRGALQSFAQQIERVQESIEERGEMPREIESVDLYAIFEI